MSPRNSYKIRIKMNNRRTRPTILAKVKRAREVADFDRLFGIKKEELKTNKKRITKYRY